MKKPGNHIDFDTMTDDEFVEWLRLVSPPCTNFSRAGRGHGEFADLGTIAITPDEGRAIAAAFKADQG